MHVVKLFSIRSKKFNWPEFCEDNHEEHDEENRLAITNIISLWFFRILFRESLSKFTREVFNAVISVINREFCDIYMYETPKKFRKHWTSWTSFIFIKKKKIKLEFILILIISNNFYNFSTFNNFRS